MAWLGLNGAALGLDWPQFSHPGPGSVHSVRAAISWPDPGLSSMRGEGVWRGWETEEQGTGRSQAPGICLCLLDLVSLSLSLQLVPLHGRKIRFEIFFPWDFSQLFFSRLSCLGNRCLECGCVVCSAGSACSNLWLHSRYACSQNLEYFVEHNHLLKTFSVSDMVTSVLVFKRQKLHWAKSYTLLCCCYCQWEEGRWFGQCWNDVLTREVLKWAAKKKLG